MQCHDHASTLEDNLRFSTPSHLRWKSTCQAVVCTHSTSHSFSQSQSVTVSHSQSVSLSVCLSVCLQSACRTSTYSCNRLSHNSQSTHRHAVSQSVSQSVNWQTGPREGFERSSRQLEFSQSLRYSQHVYSVIQSRLDNSQ